MVCAAVGIEEDRPFERPPGAVVVERRVGSYVRVDTRVAIVHIAPGAPVGGSDGRVRPVGAGEGREGRQPDTGKVRAMRSQALRLTY